MLPATDTMLGKRRKLYAIRRATLMYRCGKKVQWRLFKSAANKNYLVVSGISDPVIRASIAFCMMFFACWSASA